MVETVNWPTSSQVFSTKYDDEKQELTVKFKTGTYAYNKVPKATWDYLKQTSSIGKFINTMIKPHHSYTKLPS